MTHDHPLITQLGRQRRRIVFRVTGEDKVRGRWQHFKAQRLQLRDHLLATVDHPLAGLFEIFAVGKRCRCANNGDTIKRIGVEAVLDSLQRFDQIRMAHRQADTQTGQGARLGQGLGDQQVRITVHQADGRFAAKVDIRFIHHDHRIRVGLEDLFDGLQRQQATGRCIGVGEDDPAIGPGVVRRLDLELLIQCYGVKFDAIQPAVNRIKTVTYIRKQQRFVVLEQAIENMGQHFVRAVAQKHLIGLHTVILGHRLLKQVAVRVGV